MKQYKMASAVMITGLMFFLASISAWAEKEPRNDESSMTSAEEIAPADTIDTAEEAEPTGLNVVMDGSNLEAFEKSLEKVKETGSKEDYKGLKGAIDYLLFYDLGAGRDLEKLAARLDGLTANEVIKRVGWRRP